MTQQIANPSAFRLNGGQGNIELKPDGSVHVRVVYQLGFGVQLLPGSIIVVEESFTPKDSMTDDKLNLLAQAMEKWKTK